MKEDMFEKKVIEQLQRLSIPAPDPAFAERVYQQFKRQVQKKRKVQFIQRGLIWASSLCMVALFTFSLWQNGLFKEQADLRDDLHLAIDPTSEGNQLYEIDNYVNGERGVWSFYSNESYNEIYIASKDEKPVLVHSVKEGYVNAHIYPNPSNPNEVMFIVFESKENEIDRQFYFFVDEDGNIEKMNFLPEYGYSATTIHWSPNGEKAVVHLNNAMYRNTLLGLIDIQTLQYSHLYGNAEPHSDPRRSETALGSTPMSLVTWVTNEVIVLLDNDRDTFFTFTITDSSDFSRTMHTFPVENIDMQGVELYPVPKSESVIVKTGNGRLDIGFDPSFRLYVFNPSVPALSPITPSDNMEPEKYEQDFLMLTDEGDPLISTTFIKGEQVQLTIQQIDPATNTITHQYRETIPYALSNPVVYPSPYGHRIAIQYYGEKAEYIDGVKAYQYVPFYVFIDLDTQKSMTYEYDGYEFMEWVDHEHVKFGEIIVKLDELS